MLHTYVDSRDGQTISPAYLLCKSLILTHQPALVQCLCSCQGGSSLKGERLIPEFFHMLDHLIEVGNANEYYLQRLNDELRPLPGTAIE